MSQDKLLDEDYYYGIKSFKHKWANATVKDQAGTQLYVYFL